MSKEPLGRYFTATSRHLQGFINNRLKPYNIGGGQYLFFINIYHHEGLSQDELSDILHVDKMTTSKMVKKLVEAGYVKKMKNPQDRRFSRLYLSEKGHEVCPRVRRILDDTTDILVSGLTQKEEQQVRALLPKMLSNAVQYTRTMKAEQQFSAKVEEFRAEITALPDVLDVTCIQQTAIRLERLHFMPTLMLPATDFPYFSKTGLLAEIELVADLTDGEIQAQGIELHQTSHDIKLEQIGLLVYHFKLLTRLRQNDPRAWDEIDELYVDD